MRHPLLKSVLSMVVLACACACATVAFAQSQPWQAVVIGQPGPGAEGAFADAFHAAQALRDGQITELQLLRDRPRADIEDAIDSLAGVPRVLVYIAAPLGDDGQTILLRGGGLALFEIVQRLSDRGTNQVALLIEDCTGPQAAGLQIGPTPQKVDLFIAASAGPGGTCPGQAGRLTDQLSGAAAQPDQPINVTLAGAWQRAAEAASTMRPFAAPPSSLAPTDVYDAVSIVANDVVRISPVSLPASARAQVQPILASAPASRQVISSKATQGETVVIFMPPPQTQMAARALRAGLPEPSVIVGLIDGEDIQDTAEISYDNLVARQNLRHAEPELFAQLAQAGAFDPPPSLVALAIQTELARMRCYTTGIDGIWGNGSRNAVGRYFAQRSDVAATTMEPAAQLFRQIITADDVTCPAPVAAARNVRQTTSPAAAPTRRATPAAAKPAAQAPAPNTRKIQSGTTLGVFR
ncbi:hypothetical protein BFP70_04900 [Thioclava sp. SK-1]|uniref:hypothetical protein n=1 Tax=Thioclava sp. SK-1 TaxID=1889770 RepID=UPI0008271B4A|nr:hypothetical protein [Thioclava sp. SK-1]OCX66561.1 hypothetical protein BFP70_04900 [Thioclava sp. SK-1]